MREVENRGVWSPAGWEEDGRAVKVTDSAQWLCGRTKKMIGRGNEGRCAHVGGCGAKAKENKGEKVVTL